MLQIVQATYEAIPEGKYSDQIVSTIQKCITVDPAERPDIVGVGAHMADKIMSHMDRTRQEQIKLEKKLEQEKKRIQRRYNEAYKNVNHFHTLYQVTQERYDKLANLASSGSGSSIKDDTDMNESVFSDIEASTMKARTISGGSGGNITNGTVMESVSDDRTLTEGGQSV